MKRSRLEAEVYRALRRINFYQKERPLLEDVLERLDTGVNVVQLPTGYGKTALPVVCGLTSFIDTENYLRSLHVLPLRSIIEDAYHKTVEAMKKIGLKHVEEHTAQQMMNVPGSPFLNKKLVFVTFETFSLHLMKLPPPEMQTIICPSFFSFIDGWKTFGHFEIGRGAVFESFVFIDEPQLLVDRQDVESEGFLSSVVRALAGMNTPVTLMSATVSKGLREMARAAAQAFNKPYRELVYGENIHDKDFENIQKNKRVTTSVVHGSLADVASRVLDESRWNKVLVVANTVEKAKQVYGVLRDRGALLLHGRLTRQDRLKVLDELRKERWVVVSTQVVEAGVDVSADALVSEGAPASALVQRAGRVARRDDDREGEIIVVDEETGPYDPDIVSQTITTLEKALNEGEVEWRLPKSEKGIGYSQLVDIVHNRDLLPPNNAVLNQILNPLSMSTQAVNIINDDMVTVYVGAAVDELNQSKSYTSELRQLVKHHPEARAVKIDDQNNYVLSDLTVRKIALNSFPQLKILCEKIVGFMISEESYLNEAYGVAA